MNSKICLSSNSYEWSTPLTIFDSLNLEFGPFDLDPCASSWNAKCSKYYTKSQDGIKQCWNGRVFVNPPYGREIGKWIKKGYESSLNGAIVVMLVPARTDTSWWHNYCIRGEVRFMKGRIHFVKEDGKSGPATFPSAVVIFRPTNTTT